VTRSLAALRGKPAIVLLWSSDVVAARAALETLDRGAPALLRAGVFRAVIGLSVPYRPRGSMRPTSVMPKTDEAMFYQ